jgi:nicotinamidase-related amidase
MTTALLLIDLQNGVVTEPDGDAYRLDETLAVARGLLDQARDRGVPVVHIQHMDEWMQPGSNAFAIHDRVAPIDGEPVIVKEVPSGFEKTALAETLHGLGIEHLVIAGAQTEVCVEATTRAALSKGFAVTLVADGHTTWDSKTATAAEIVAETNSVLAEQGAAVITGAKVEW